MILRKFAIVLSIFAVFASSFLGPARVSAQVTGATISGILTDSSGASIPNAQVSIKNEATNVTTNVTTNSDGFYTVPNLLPGTYEVILSAPGFATEVQSNIVLAVGANQVLPATMKVGQTTEKVVVTGEAPTVQLATSALGGEITGTTVRELPLNGRDWTQLATLQAGVTNVRTQASAQSATASRGNRGFGNQLTDSGHGPYQNNYRVNGIAVNDYTNTGPGSVLGVALGVDAIQEFSVLTSNYSAEYGRSSGAVINAITKSGANQFHGDAYWFLRDEGLDARNYFDTSLPPFHRNQFGASGGGPVKRNKAFIFGDYEGIRQNKSLTFHDFVPSSATRSGNLCSHPDGTCTPTAVAVDPLVRPFLALYPSPNSGIVGNGDIGVFNSSGLATLTENYVTIRGDYKISEKDALVVSWYRDEAPLSAPDALLDSTAKSSTNRQMASLEETHIFSPAFVNTARFGYSRSVGLVDQPGSALNPLAANLGLGAIPGRYAPILDVPGLTEMAGALGDASFDYHNWNSFQAYDDAFLTRGTHSLKMGFSVEREQYNVLDGFRANGNFTFPSLAGFLTNTPTSLTLLVPGTSSEVGNRQSLFGAYVQDDWHWRPNLTLNLGLRYEPTSLPAEAHNRFQALRDFFGGVPVPVKHLWDKNQTLLNFEPRVGLSWDPFRNGKTAVRGGFGIYDVLPIIWEWAFVNSAAVPFELIETQGSGLPPGSFPTGAVALVGSSLTQATVRYVGAGPGQLNPHRSYAMNWNLNIQREIAPSVTAEIGYEGSHSIHLPYTPDDYDVVLPTSTSAGFLWPCGPKDANGNCTLIGSSPRLNNNVGAIHATVWNDSASYQGLHAQVTKMMSHSFQVQGSYTWGKCIDNGPSAPLGDPFLNSPASLLFFDRHVQHGPCDFNVTHNFVLNYVWNIPTPKFGRVAKEVLGGWEVGGILTAATGTPFTLLMGGDPVGQIGSPWPEPDRLHGPGCNGNPVNPGNVNHYVKLNCFTPPTAPASFAPLCQPAAPTVAALIPNTCMNLFGNEGRNQLTGPGLVDLDFSLFKNFPIQKISESFNVQFRAEFFNIFNHPNFQAPVDNLQIFNQDGTPVPTGGAIDSTTTDPRQIQFGLKIVW